MKRISFEKSLKKGTIGEQIVQGILESKGFVVYRPITDGAHSFDIMAIKNRKNAIAIDVKAKARMSKWRATGVDVRDFNGYMQFSIRHNMPFWLIFVDECERRIYGNTITELEKPGLYDRERYPREISTMTGHNIRLWHLDQMITIATLGQSQCDELRAYNQRSYAY